MPALERYDGIFYRVLRRWLQTASDEQRARLMIFILSAEFGLIEATTPIPYYDRQMSLPRAAELAPQAVARLRELLPADCACDILLAMGKVYQRALMPIEQWLPPFARLRIVGGGIGRQAAQLKAWLSEE